MIRRATAADADAVAELYERSFATLDFLPTLHTLDEHRRHFMNVITQQEVWLWEDEGRPLGFAAVSDEDELSFLYLEPDELGRGIGSALFEHVKARRPNGFSFWVFQQNARARRFYEKHGARVVELTDGAGNEEQAPDARYVWSPPDRPEA